MAESVRHARLQDINFKKFKEKKKEEELPTLQQFFLTSKEGQTFSSRDRKF